MVRVFIIGSQADHVFVARLTEDLQAAGFEVLNEQLGPEYDWQAAMFRARVVLVIATPETLEAQVTRNMADHAYDRENIIIPLRIDATHPTTLPFPIEDLQYIDLYDAVYAQNIERLFEIISSHEISEETGVYDEPESDEITFEDAAPETAEDEMAEEEMAFEEPMLEEPAPPPPPAPTPAEPEPAAKREATRERRAERAKEEAAPPPAAQYGAAEPGEMPHFTAFYPQAIKPAQAYALMVFAHLENARDAVRDIAAGYKQMMGGAQSSESAPSKLQIDPGSLITVVPQIDGITFSPAELVIAWGPPHVSATFLFTAPDALPAELSGRVLVYHGPLIAGEIPVTLKRAASAEPAEPAPQQSAEMHTFDPIFASYSHRDTPVMEYFRRTRENMGQKMLVDIYDLRSGEHWAERLLEMIDESAVFQLFWSANSAQSKYCRQEWEHALQYLDQRPRFVQPVYWSAPGPNPAPPPELADLHFQHVQLPPLTRVQIALAKAKKLFRGD